MKYVRYLIVLLVLLVMASPMIVRADTFDFTFATVNGDFSGSGVFDTYPFATDPVTGDPIAYSGFYISALDGEVNGIPMVLAPGHPGSAMDYFGPLPPIPNVPLTIFTEYNFLNGALNFTLDGQAYFIHDVDQGPGDLLGLNLFGPGGNELITMSVIPEAEPSTLSFSLLGLGFVFILFSGCAGGRFRVIRGVD